MKKKWGLLLCCVFSTVLLQPAVRSHAQSKVAADKTKVAVSRRLELVESTSLKGLSFRLDQLLARSHALRSGEVVRVLLADRLLSADIKHSGPVYVYAVGGHEKYSLSGSGTLQARLDDKGVLHLTGVSAKGPIVVDPQHQTKLTFKGRVYDGVFYLIPSERGILVVEHNNLEEYLLGVVGHEMSPSWPVEALKAQAVAARNFARIKMQHKDANYDLTNRPSDQVYKGSGGEVEKNVRKAVEGTAGEVLMYRNKLFSTFYHANCGGHTVNGKVLMGSHAPNIQPLQGVTCNTCSGTYNAHWTAEISQNDIDIFVHRNSELSDPIVRISIAETEDGSDQETGYTKRVTALRFSAGSGSTVLSCNALQHEVGSNKLKTCKIENIQRNKENDSFVFTGHGFGHGVGMCQDGAKGMAQQGHNYREILAHYFPGAELVSL